MCKTTVYEKSGREFEREQGEVYGGLGGGHRTGK